MQDNTTCAPLRCSGERQASEEHARRVDAPAAADGRALRAPHVRAQILRVLVCACVSACAFACVCVCGFARAQACLCRFVCMGVCSVFTRACMHGGSYCGHRFVATQTDVLNVEEVQNPLTVEAVVLWRCDQLHRATAAARSAPRQSEQRSGTVSDSGVARMHRTNAMGVHLRCTTAPDAVHPHADATPQAVSAASADLRALVCAAHSVRSSTTSTSTSVRRRRRVRLPATRTRALAC